MIDEHLPFLRAVAANPADDLPRLVFADFLEETGEPDSIARAHFIRAQIALTQLVPGSAEYRETEALQDRLLNLYLGSWIWDLPDHLHTDGRPVWQRGFIESVRLSWRDLLTSSALFETVPITRVQIAFALVNYYNMVAQLEACHHVSRLTHLRFGPGINPAAMNGHSFPENGLLHLFSRSRHFAGLQHLDISGNAVASEVLTEFLLRFEEASFAESLRELDLSDIPGLGDAVGSTLATARGLESLDRLILKRTELSEPVRAMLRRRFGERVVF